MINICIDGPSGAGKSTVAKILAKKLNILYLDTGATFRALALGVIDKGIDSKNKEDVLKVVNASLVDITFKDGKMSVFLDGKDVTGLIRQNGVSMVASDISAYAEVREKLMTDWRRIAAENNSVLDGRDIGTVVLPNAKYKFYLTADSYVRAERRCKELESKGEIVSLETVKREIEERDYNDSHRTVAPLKKAEDAELIDSSNLTIDEVVGLIINKLSQGE